MHKSNCPAAAGMRADGLQVSSGLNLWLELIDNCPVDKLLKGIEDRQEQIDAALVNLHHVHFARFVPTPDLKALQVITAFDGELDAYVLDFALAIGETFEFILGFVKNRPRSPVIDHPSEFLQFIRDNNLGLGSRSGGGIGLFSAYPAMTVIDIVGASGIAPAAVEPVAVAVDRSDVQANVLRGLNARHGWYAGWRFGSAAGAGALLGELLAGSQGAPRLSNDVSRAKGAARPHYWLTLGFSFSGLLALVIDEYDQAAFCRAHQAFVRGPDELFAAMANGDHGASDPAFWQLGNDYPVDMLVALYADDADALAEQVDALKARCAAHGLSLVNKAWPVEALVDEEGRANHREHFGYVDGLSQPRLAIAGAADVGVGKSPDMQPRAGVGEFLLGKGYANVYGGKNSLGGLSPALANNASFAALRIMAQEVVAFEKLLDEASARHGVDREWLAARLMGRWRDGTPVSQSPDAALDEAGAPARNNFDYLPSYDHPSTLDDSAGLRCPVGAHARRMNPRSARVAGRAHSRRLLRRSMPYGPRHLPGSGDDGQARGLVGLFLCADLDRQFEFLLRQWAQGDAATAGIRGELDPLLGTPMVGPDGTEPGAKFRIPRPGGQRDIVLDLPRLVSTIGSVYLFMPGLGGVRRLIALAAVQAKKTAGPLGIGFKSKPVSALAAHAALTSFGLETAALAGPAVDPATLDPRSIAFRDNPFDDYAWFRDNQPMAELKLMNSTWIFSHRQLAEIAGDGQRFCKREAGDDASAGLLNMDSPGHAPCRAEIQPMFDAALKALAPKIPDLVRAQYLKTRSKPQPVDWLADFARPLARALFFQLFGLRPEDAGAVIKAAEAALALASPANDPKVKKAVKDQLKACGTALYHLIGSAKPSGIFAQILGMSTLHDAASNKAETVLGFEYLSALEVEQLANATTLVLAGIQPLQWFITLATWRLLENDGALLQQLKADPGISNRDVVDELLRFDTSTPMSDRYVAATTQVDGRTFKAGQRITLVWASANRDEAEFGPDADTINLRRGKGPGWAFGAAGDRHCLGSELVYAVMAPVIQTLREANPVPRLQAGFKPTWGKGALFRPMAALKLHC